MFTFNYRSTLRRAADELQQAHSHCCPACEENYGCLSEGCQHGPKLCPACDPQMFDCDRGYHWRLDLPLVERVRAVRQHAIEVWFRHNDYRPVVSDQRQIQKLLRYLSDRAHTNNPHARALWHGLRCEAMRN